MTDVRRYLVPVLLLAPAVFVCGMLLLTPLTQAIDDPVAARKYYIIDAGGPLADVRGWPWIFLKSVTREWPPQNGRPETFYFSWWFLLADLAVLSLVVVAVGAVLGWHRW